jgi:hypothetical protein
VIVAAPSVELGQAVCEIGCRRPQCGDSIRATDSALPDPFWERLEDTAAGWSYSGHGNAHNEGVAKLPELGRCVASRRDRLNGGEHVLNVGGCPAPVRKDTAQLILKYCDPSGRV